MLERRSCEAPTDGSCLFTLRRLLSRFILSSFFPDLRFTKPEWKVAAADESALLLSLMKEKTKESIEDNRRPPGGHANARGRLIGRHYWPPPATGDGAGGRGNAIGFPATTCPPQQAFGEAGPSRQLVLGGSEGDSLRERGRPNEGDSFG